MSEINGLLNIGRMALQANQGALSVTAHNQANLNTPGYSRQTAVLMAGAGGVGGVQIGEVRRVVDRFIEDQLLAERSNLGGYEVDQRVLSRLESLFNDGQGTGLQDALNGFFAAVQDLSNNPQGRTERVATLSASRSLARQFASISDQMRQMRVDLNSDVLGTLETINDRTTRIAELNQLISRAEVGGAASNDLRDERARLLNDLSEQIDISTVPDEEGRVAVLTAGGKPLVLGGAAYALRGAADPLNGSFVNVESVSSGGTATDITASIGGGRLKSLLDMRDRALPDGMDQLDSLASGIITTFNTQHQTGFDLNGAAGGAFFVATPVGARAASAMAVAITDPNLIAAASAAGAPGDNGNVLLLARLQNAPQATLGNASYQEFYGSLVGVVGAQSRAAGWNLSAQGSIMTQLTRQRESVSGVSLDEEMTNVIKFQRAYEAAARLISTADEMMQTILDMKR
jgi:flagellar hook-associated protein 1 FlgK